MSLSDKIDNIELKVKHLAIKLERLQNENTALQEENELLKAELDRKNDTVDNLKNKLKESQQVLEVNREENPEHNVKLREQIDQYIIEIDKCIEWLQNY